MTVHIPTRRGVLTAASVVAAAAAALGGAPRAAATVTTAPMQAFHRAVCGRQARGFVRCHADVRTDARGVPLTTAAPAGLAPTDLQQAYSLTALPGATTSPIIAIVDAYGYPTAAADLAHYRAAFRLPPCGAGTGAKQCLRVVNERGRTASLPRANAGWGEEQATDLDAASATCPSCRLLLVEADSSSLPDLAAAADEAAKMGANVVSASFGAPDYADAHAYDAAFQHAGVRVVASSGDDGFGVSYPASLPHVVAAGGTSLMRADVTRGFVERAWTGAGSGCATLVRKPAWQHDAGCRHRTVADISADADPDTGIAVFDSASTSGHGGWLTVGGTSVAAPLIAGIEAGAQVLWGRPAAWNVEPPPWRNAASVRDVRGGSNGVCAPSYLCASGIGYDGPTGLGTPIGYAAMRE
jgi:subtilase family serine protease